MEKFQQLREDARKKIHIADHMITQTYPLVRDPKLLVSVLENVFIALSYSMSSLLHYERMFKRIPPFHENFDSKYIILHSRLAKKHNIEQRYVSMIRDIREILIAHKQSPIEFSRKDKFVICNEDYKMKTLGIEDLKEYIKNSKEFITITEHITTKNEDLFT